MQAAHFDALRYHHLLAGAGDALERILARVVHCGGGRHRRGQKCLYLIGSKTVLLEPQCELEHVLIAGAGVSGDEVRNQILFLARLLRVLVEQLLEPVVAPTPGFIIFDSGPSPMASGAIFRYPPV